MHIWSLTNGRAIEQLQRLRKCDCNVGMFSGCDYLDKFCLYTFDPAIPISFFNFFHTCIIIDGGGYHLAASTTSDNPPTLHIL